MHETEKLDSLPPQRSISRCGICLVKSVVNRFINYSADSVLTGCVSTTLAPDIAMFGGETYVRSTRGIFLLKRDPMKTSLLL